MDILHLSTEHVDGATVVISLRGELDVATTPRFTSTIAELVSLGHNRLVLDLEHLHFIDSTGLGAFIGAQNRAREAHGNLFLRSVPERIVSMLSVVGLDGVLEVEPGTVDGNTEADLALR